jgi:hypothetical protein
MKVHAGLLYLSGISMHRIACLLRVSAPSVLNWLRTLAQEHCEKPEPPSRAIILELDEMIFLAYGVGVIKKGIGIRSASARKIKALF